jgi:methionyl-tRNA synthetase
MKKYTLTAALPYANGALHLGHLAGVYVPADMYARYLRLRGEDVLFVCGSDEHGAAITMRAKKEGISPQEIIDKYHNLNKATFEKLGISFDIFDRTSSATHKATAQEFFTALYEKGGEFDEKPSEQYFDEKYQQFLADRYIVGTCPKCGYEEAFGDQCESCGSDLAPTELIKPRSVLSGAAPVLRPTTHWYFRLDKHAEWLEKWVKEGVVDGVKLHEPAAWREHVKAQCLSWVQGQLQPRAITRDLDWGVPVPLPQAEGKVLYVWFDAPIGYISATKVWAEANQKNWKHYWKGDDVELVHFIGKDNIVFHTVIFPAMLRAHGGYALPKNVPANQFLNLEGRKFSKSKGWVIEQHEYLNEFAEFPNAADALRYVLARNAPEQKDGDFKWDDFVAAYDNELADNLGNFLNRVMSFAYKYFGGKVPKYDTNLYAEERAQLTKILEELESNLRAYRFKDAVQNVMEISRFGNGFLQEKAPWLLYKANPEDENIANSIGFSLQIAATLSILTSIFIPFVAEKTRQMLNFHPTLAADGKEWQAITAFLANNNPILAEGHQLGEQVILFPKISDKKNPQFMALVDAQKQKLEQLKTSFLAAEKLAAAKIEAEKAAESAKDKTNIEFADFEKIDLRTATILTAERVPKSDKLLKLTVDLGYEQRTVVSGIAQSFEPEQVIGQQVTLVANLAPRKMMGIMSQGMILMANDADGKLVFVAPTRTTPNGGIVK